MASCTVVGAGLAGLRAAGLLAGSGVEVVLLEASDGVGGRVRTDAVGGFLCDRGFQVLLEAYPEAVEALDYAALDLRRFEAGALVRVDGRFARVADPVREPRSVLSTLRAPIGTLADKTRIGVLRQRACAGTLEELWARPETTTLERLRAIGFSGRMIDTFFRPFLGGIQLDPTLATSSRELEFVFRMFATGPVSVPAAGMGALTAQLAAVLPAGALRLEATVARLEGTTAVLADGERVESDAVVVATEGPSAAQLLEEIDPPAGHGVTNVLLAAPEPLVGAPILVLDGEGTGPVNSVAELSAVAPSYAPSGRTLVSVAVLEGGDPGWQQGSATPADGSEAPDPALLDPLLAQLRRWYGPVADRLEHVRTYRIPHAQPDQAPPALAEPARPVRLDGGRYVCGDHRQDASINGALASGRRAAEAVLADLAR